MTMLTQLIEAAVSYSQNSQDCTPFSEDFDGWHARQGKLLIWAVFEVVETIFTPIVIAGV